MRAIPLLAIALSACSAPPLTPTVDPPMRTPVATSGSAPTVTPTHEPTVLPTPTPDCRSSSGRVVHGEVDDAALFRPLPYRVYIPPCAGELQGELPVLYLLHGLARTDSQWEDIGAVAAAERLIQSGELPPFLIVMPWERKGLDYEDTILNYLLPQIAARYGSGNERAIGGISRGAGWALRVGVQHPELFEAVGLHSPAVLVPDLFYLPDWIEQAEPPALWIDIGDRDSLRFEAQELVDLLDELEVEYRSAQFEGEHTEAYWSEHVEEYLRWYASHWGD